MTLPAVLIPTLDALLSSGEWWLPLAEATNDSPGPWFLRRAHERCFDLLAVHDGAPKLDWTDQAEALYEREPSHFVPAVEARRLEPVPLANTQLERAQFVDAQFATVWAGLERGEVDAQLHSFEDQAALRGLDGQYWKVRETSGEVVLSADLMAPELLAWSLRARLWEGQRPRTRPVPKAQPARVRDALSVEAILRAPQVEVRVQSTLISSGYYRLRGTEAFRFEARGEVDDSEPGYSFTPCSRTAVERALRSESTVVTRVDYALRT